MTTRMLIDARHPEETRVAVLKGNRIEEFDFESADRKQIKGNIYLAKVTRVEPSLQAAFVDFGGNRHGFLAFSEIHPDYYQIPKEDREALLAEEAAHADEEAALRAAEDGDDDYDDDDGGRRSEAFDDSDLDDDGGVIEVDTSDKDQVSTIEGGHVENGYDNADDDNGNGKHSDASRDYDDDDRDYADADREGDGSEDAGHGDGSDTGGESSRQRGRRQGRGNSNGGSQNRGRAKEADDLRARRMALRRRYKIQDVIQRRQVLLVQVVKEERGNKGAALTTYLSLAGRYCVLMPNSSTGGGISRKINSASDRKRLKGIIAEMALPRSMGCIVRTAGLSRTKTEIKRDFDYLDRLWDEIRETTLGSSAPALIHSDSDLIKRAIRDIYNREIEEVIVEGSAGYTAARDFMKLLMPSHARRVKAYADPVPLFQRYGAEDQLTAMYDPVVQLRSGGYMVINPTEALVSIDINSGRSTKEHGIEATALNTNLEAAREIARQLRLRDMAGLVVIDFIDMEYSNNIRKVEKAMKDALKDDRARIQVGRISSFGLMEMSRQRLRTGVLEATTRGCPHCDGTGFVRTASSSGLAALRSIEDEAAKGRGIVVSLFASTEASIYLLNAKRADLSEIEERYGVRVEVIPEGENEGAKMRVISSGPRNEFVPVFQAIVESDDDLPPEDDYEDEDEREDSEAAPRGETAEEREERSSKRRKRRRGRGRRDEQNGDEARESGGSNSVAETADGESHGDAGDDEADGPTEARTNDEAGAEGEAPRKRRRRSRRRRGGRREDGSAEANGEGNGEEGDDDEAGEADAEASSEAIAPIETADAEPPTKPKRVRRKKADVEAPAAEETVAAEAPAEAEPAAEPAAKPKRTRRKKADDETQAGTEATTEAPVPEEAPAAAEAEAPAKPARARRKKAEIVDEGAAVYQAVTGEVKPAPAPVAEALVAQARTEAISEPAADGDEASEKNADGSPRRGWWQRTFGT